MLNLKSAAAAAVGAIGLDERSEGGARSRDQGQSECMHTDGGRCFIRSKVLIIVYRQRQSCACAGINLCHGQQHSATGRLHNWLVHLTSPGGCQRADTAERVKRLCRHHWICGDRLMLQSRDPVCLARPNNPSGVWCRRPISKDLFLDHFWWCHARLKEKADDDYGMAAYFRFLTLVGEHTHFWAESTRKMHRLHDCQALDICYSHNQI